MTSTPTSPVCSPAHSTNRSPDRQTDGSVAARIAKVLGRPLIPWQRHALDLAGEIDPDTGRHAYQRVVLIVPRRAGKSLLMLARGLAGGLAGASRRSFYTSAHRENAARMWRDDWFPAVQSCPLRSFTKLTHGNGTETITWRANRSTFRLVAATGSAIRGAATNLVVIDEAREIRPDAGDALEAAVFPTQATGAGGQTWIVSNAGTADSLWLARWRDLGRAAVAADTRRGLCYIEYAAPDDADPDDEATWWQAHPALGYHLNIDAMRADHQVMSPDVFGAEYLGRWPESLVDSTLLDAWHASPLVDELVDPVVFAVEIDEDRTTADIVAVGGGPGDRLAVELVDRRPHGSWVVPRLAELCHRWDPIGLGLDAGGPAAALMPELVNVPTRIMPLQTRETTAAAGAFHDLVVQGGVARASGAMQLEMDAAIIAGRRRRSAGAWLYDRRQPGAGPLIAASLAAWVRRGSGAPPTIT